MEWIEYFKEIVLALGGLAGIAAFIKAFIFTKQEKKSKEIENEGKEINNEGSQIENEHKIVEDYQALVNWLKDSFSEYKQEVDTRVGAVKIEVDGMKKKIDNLEKVISEAYHCPYPPSFKDCPVVKALETNKKCEECRKRGSDECIECKE